MCPGSHNQLACTPTALPVTQTCRAMSEAARLPPLLAVSRLSLPTRQDTDRVTLCLPRSPTQAGHPSLMLACPMRIWVNSRISMPSLQTKGNNREGAVGWRNGESVGPEEDTKLDPGPRTRRSPSPQRRQLVHFVTLLSGHPMGGWVPAPLTMPSGARGPSMDVLKGSRGALGC